MLFYVYCFSFYEEWSMTLTGVSGDLIPKARLTIKFCLLDKMCPIKVSTS